MYSIVVISLFFFSWCECYIEQDTQSKFESSIHFDKEATEVVHVKQKGSKQAHTKIASLHLC